MGTYMDSSGEYRSFENRVVELLKSIKEGYQNPESAAAIAADAAETASEAAETATAAAETASTAAEAIESTVLYVDQELTDTQKGIARENIGAASVSDIPTGAVCYDTAQDLTDEQKAQAVANIGAASNAGLVYDNEITGSVICFNRTNEPVQKIEIDAEGDTSVLTVCGKNIYPKYSSGSANDLSWTVADDGTITFSGTPSADTLLRLQNLSMLLGGTTVTVSLANNMTNAKLSFFGISSTGQNNWQVDMNSTSKVVTRQFTDEYNCVELRLRVPKDFDATGLTIKPMLVFGSTVGDFEAYSGQSYNVTLDDGVVQESIPLKNGTNTVFASNGNVTVSLIEEKTIPAYVEEQISPLRQQYYRYEVSEGARYLHIYYKSGDNWVKWQLHNAPIASINSDTWQIGRICGLDGSLGNLVEIVRGGEFELAFRENGAEDYCGGNNHGDENTEVFKLFIDGHQVVLTELDGEMHPFTRIDAFEIAVINRCDTPGEDILKHQKIWTFEDGKVRVRQSIKYLETLSVDTALVCMFAALRSAFLYGIRKGGVAIEDMTTSTFEKVHTVGNDMFYEYYGTVATAKIHAVTDNPENKSDMWINNTTDLNKLYFGYYGVTDSAHPVEVAQDTVITAYSEYEVAYTPATT